MRHTVAEINRILGIPDDAEIGYATSTTIQSRIAHQIPTQSNAF